MRQYELTYIIRPDLDEEATAAVAQRVEQVINANGGRLLKTDRWGKRRLAYPIQNHSEGFYLLLLTELNDVAIREIERHMKLSEDIIRHLLVRVEAEEAAEVTEGPAEEAAAEEAAEVTEQPAEEAEAEEAAEVTEQPAEEAAAEEAAEVTEGPVEEAEAEEAAEVAEQPVEEAEAEQAAEVAEQPSEGAEAEQAAEVAEQPSEGAEAEAGPEEEPAEPAEPEETA